MYYIFFSIIFFLFSFPLFSQYNQANIWYFGNGNGIDFNTNPPKKLLDGKISTHTINTICDKKGNLLFYTDGMTVINKNHRVMKNGIDLLGHCSQSIVPFPNNENLYYLFTISVDDTQYTYTNKEIVDPLTTKIRTPLEREQIAKKHDTLTLKQSQLYYHIIDISKNNGLGEVIQKNQMLYKKVWSDLIVARHANNKDYWLITHEFESNIFKTYLINEKGLQPIPIESKTGNAFRSNISFASGWKNEQIVISSDFKVLVTNDWGFKHIEMFSFDNMTGVLEKRRNIKYEYFSELKGLEFSPNSSKLYLAFRNLTEYGVIFTLKQYDLTNENMEKNVKIKIRDIKKYDDYNKLANDEYFGGALRLAPNGKIYALKFTKNVAVIENPDEDLENLKINYNVFDYPMWVLLNLGHVAHLLPPFYSPIKLGDLFQREILFETGKYDLKTWHYPILSDIVKFLKENQKTTISIAGHTDNEGNPQANKTLSLQRAKAVESYFISQNIAKNRIISEGFGDTKPLLDNATPENKRKNRRIEFLIK